VATAHAVIRPWPMDGNNIKRTNTVYVHYWDTIPDRTFLKQKYGNYSGTIRS